MQSQTEIQKGSLLIAEPFMLDPGFKRSAIILCDHGIEGSVGFILNKPIDMDVSRLLPDFPEFDADVYYGGPVATDTLHYIHTTGDIVDDSILIADGVYWGGSFEQIKVFIEKGLIGSHQIKFFVGYSGWSVGQLHEEISIGSWFTAEYDLNYVFAPNKENLWHVLLKHKGSAFAVIADMKDDMILN